LFFHEPSGARREVIGETAGIGETPPSLDARQLFGWRSTSRLAAVRITNIKLLGASFQGRGFAVSGGW
jgi:hypothetical protein